MKVFFRSRTLLLSCPFSLFLFIETLDWKLP